MTAYSNPARLSVCMFTNAAIRAGAENHMLDLLQRLDRDHFELSLACPEPLLKLLEGDLPAHVRTVAISIRRPTDWHAMASFCAFLRRARIQIVHSHGFYSSLFASPLAKLAGVPVAVETPHLREYWRHGWKASYAVDRLIGRFVDRYIAVSEANQRYLIQDKRLSAEKIRVIRNGCELRKFNPRHQAPAGLRRQLGFGETDPVLLVNGRLEPQKGHSVLFQALARVRRELANVRLVCLGDGALRGALEAQAQDGITDCIRFAGYQRNVEDWFALADICVLPSFFEGLPLVAIESLAAGRPMIATAVDGTPEVIVNEQTGLTVPPGDADALAAAMIRLWREPELRARFRSRGRRWVEEHFDLARQVRETGDLYQETWQQRTGRRFACAEVAELPQTVARSS